MKQLCVIILLLSSVAIQPCMAQKRKLLSFVFKQDVTFNNEKLDVQPITYYFYQHYLLLKVPVKTTLVEQKNAEIKLEDGMLVMKAKDEDTSERRIEKFKYLLTDSFEEYQHTAVLFEEKSKYQPQIIEIVEIDKEIPHYTKNLQLGTKFMKTAKKRISSNKLGNGLWIDKYIISDQSKGTVDSISINYDAKLKNIPFSFSKELDKLHSSKVSSIQVRSLNMTNRKVLAQVYYKIEEKRIEVSAKIDSIFTELIPYLPKR
jgi:hypothetical protein